MNHLPDIKLGRPQGLLQPVVKSGSTLVFQQLAHGQGDNMIVQQHGVGCGNNYHDQQRAVW
jgi:hypothetical protein